MARRPSRPTRLVLALGAAGLAAAFAVPAVASATTGPAAPGSPTAIGDAPMTSDRAADRASAVYDAGRESAVLPVVPLVTTEKTPTGPRIEMHEVSSEAQARAVARNAARGNDLVGVEQDRPITASAFTNDQYSSMQWALNPLKTSFLEAWQTTTGTGITVAVVDTGVAAGHPDLAGKVLPGHEFLNGGLIDRDVPVMTDGCGHGTHVAGTIAAVAQNGIGVAGAAPGVKILPVRVLNCGGWTSDVAAGITWAANHGARVINLSVGGPGPDRSLALAVKYARSKGAVVVAAAGNNHGTCTPYQNATSYPGATTGAIGVGAIDSNFQHACFSNTGTYVDLAAPGVGIVSTYPPNTYAQMDGTSMATPHVSAAAALVLAKRPWCTPDEVEARLEATAVRLGSPTYPNKLFGAGLIDPAKAVSGPC
jgi:subtilisin family serine protease